MNIQPRNDLVLVKRLLSKYAGNLFIPDTAQEKPIEAVVVAVGPGTEGDVWRGEPGYDGYRIPIDLRKGDIVFIGRYAGTEIEENGEKLLFIRENEILGVRRG